MTSIDIETILTIIYVLVDDWYQNKGHQLLHPFWHKGKAKWGVTRFSAIARS